jgi:hypothetical protein
MDRPRSPDLAAKLFGGKPEHTLALLRAAWPTAVGEELARRTEPVAFDRGVLRVRVPDLRWQKSLLRMRGDILSRLRRVAGRASPHALGFVTGALPDPGPPVPPSPAAAAAAPPAAVVEAARGIRDDEISARFLEAAGRYLARFAPDQAAGAGGSGGDGSATS